MKRLILIPILLIGFYAISQNTSINLDKAYNDVTLSNYFFVDGTTGNDAAADGSAQYPYKTIQKAMQKINADAAAKALAGNYPASKYVLKVAPGTYSDSVVFTNEKYLRVEMAGVIISGAVHINTTQQTGDYYSKLEFVGGMSNRPEKGDNGEISGVISCTRNNDALTYLSFTGMEISNNLLFTVNGTWVVYLNHAYFSASNKFISGDFSGGGTPTVLIESMGMSRIKAHIADTDGSSTNVALYDCMDTEFDLINSHSTFGGVLRNCLFVSDVTISAGTYKIDNVSYKQIVAQTENLTGATIQYMDDTFGGSVTMAGLTVNGNSLFSDMASFSDTAKVNTIAPYSGNTTEITNNVLLNDTIFFSNDTIVDLLDMTDLTGNIANSPVPLDSVFTRVIQVGDAADSLYIYSDGDYALLQCTDLLNSNYSVVQVARGNAVIAVMGAGINCLAAENSTTISGAFVIPKTDIRNLDKTPDVTGYSVLKYINSPSVSNDTITDLDNAVVDAEYTIIGSSDTYKIVIEDSSIFKMAGNVTFNLGLHDVIRFRCVSVSPNLFIEISRSDN